MPRLDSRETGKHRGISVNKQLKASSSVIEIVDELINQAMTDEWPQTDTCKQAGKQASTQAST